MYIHVIHRFKTRFLFFWKNNSENFQVCFELKITLMHLKTTTSEMLILRKVFFFKKWYFGPKNKARFLKIFIILTNFWQISGIFQYLRSYKAEVAQNFSIELFFAAKLHNNLSQFANFTFYGHKLWTLPIKSILCGLSRWRRVLNWYE